MKLDVRGWLTVVAELSIAPRAFHHLGSHVNTDGSTGPLAWLQQGRDGGWSIEQRCEVGGQKQLDYFRKKGGEENFKL